MSCILLRRESHFEVLHGSLLWKPWFSVLVIYLDHLHENQGLCILGSPCEVLKMQSSLDLTPETIKISYSLGPRLYIYIKLYLAYYTHNCNHIKFCGWFWCSLGNHLRVGSHTSDFLFCSLIPYLWKTTSINFALRNIMSCTLGRSECSPLVPSIPTMHTCTLILEENLAANVPH